MKHLLVLVFAAALLQMPAAASVTTGTWYLTQSNSLDDGVNYGQVNISADSATGVVTITVDALVVPAYGTPPFPNFGIQTFGFNANVSDPVDDWTFDLPASWKQGSGNQGSFGAFEVTVAGKGSSRLDALVFSFTLPTAGDAVADNFATGDPFFAAHVAGFGDEDDDVTSHWIASGGGVPPTIPTPGAILLGGIGIAIIGWQRRKMTL